MKDHCAVARLEPTRLTQLQHWPGCSKTSVPEATLHHFSSAIYECLNLLVKAPAFAPPLSLIAERTLME
jgi:hypothetical protein